MVTFSSFSHSTCNETNRNASRNSLKSILPSLFISKASAKFLIVDSGNCPSLYPFSSLHDSENSSFEINPESKETSKIILHIRSI